MSAKRSLDTLNTPLTLPCGLRLPNLLVKCPMQETCATPPHFDPPMDKFRTLYKIWGTAQYGMLLTGQVQVDLRFLSLAGDVTIRQASLSDPSVLAKWKEWATVAQADGTPVVVQLAHPGRMSPAGAGVRPPDMPALCPSSVPVKTGVTWLDKLALDKLLGTPKAMDHAEIDEAVANFVRGAKVAREAGFAGVQLHAAHGFLISQLLSPHTNKRTDEYGGSPGGRIKFLQRLVQEVRDACPVPFCVGVKLNSGDYMGADGLSRDEALEQVRWLVECGMVDFVEVSGGNAESTTDGLRNSFGAKSLEKAPKRESTRLRESVYSEFAERLMRLDSKVPIQLSGGFRSRNGMADAIESGLCQMIGLGRSAVLQPSLPREILLNPEIPDDEALAMSHQIRGLWLGRIVPAKVVGSGLGIQFFYWNMRRLAAGLSSDPNASVPWVVFLNTMTVIKASLSGASGRLISALRNTGVTDGQGRLKLTVTGLSGRC